MLKVEQAVEIRRCNECNNHIEPGEWHVKYNSGEGYWKNVCWYCLQEILKELKEKNRVV